MLKTPRIEEFFVITNPFSHFHKELAKTVLLISWGFPTSCSCVVLQKSYKGKWVIGIVCFHSAEHISDKERKSPI